MINKIENYMRQQVNTFFIGTRRLKKGGKMGKWIFIFGLVLVLSANLTYGEDVSPASTGSEATKIWRLAIGVHGGRFQVGYLFDPSHIGTTFGIVWGLYKGDKGPDRVIKALFSLDYAELSDVETRENSSFISFTFTPHFNILPRAPVNPYVGLGVGLGVFTGDIDGDVFPVYQAAFGFNIKASDKLHINIESGNILIYGFYAEVGLIILL